MGKLFTIGHSQHDIEYFIKMLRKYNVNYVLDVRSSDAYIVVSIGTPYNGACYKFVAKIFQI